MGKRPFMDRILEKFKDKVTRDIQDLLAHVGSADPQKIAFVAHGIKGAAASVSAEALRQAAFDLEQAARAADFKNIESLVQRLQTQAARCFDFLTDKSTHSRDFSGTCHPPG